MSMISALIDELNKSADEWNSSNMFELARMCREAADTIWQLRDDLQRTNDAVRDAEHDESMAWDRVRKAEAENAKLREELEVVGIAAYLYGRDDLKAENRKLRELVRDMWRFTGAACKKYPRLFDPAAQGGQMVQPNAIDAFEQRMRELGMEVQP